MVQNDLLPVYEPLDLDASFDSCLVDVSYSDYYLDDDDGYRYHDRNVGIDGIDSNIVSLDVYN